MTIKSKLTETDFINVSFILTYQKFFVKFITGIMIVMLVINIALLFFLPNTHFSDVVFPLLFLSAIPLLTYFGAKRNFKSNKRISETIEYQFGQNELLVKGESFTSQLTWDKIYKVTQTKSWLLIWQSRQTANVIPKRDLWESNIADLKEIVDFHKIKNNL
jgi:hypothetical protein